MRTFAALLLVSSAATVAAAQETFFGLPLGSSLKEAQALPANPPVTHRHTFDYSGKIFGALPGDFQCGDVAGRFPFGPVQVSAQWRFDASKHFVRGSIQFASSDYAAVKKIYLEKFGPPTEQRSEKTLANGANFDNEFLLWKRDRVTVELRQYLYTNVNANSWMGDTGEASIALNSYLASLEEQNKKTKGAL